MRPILLLVLPFLCWSCGQAGANGKQENHSSPESLQSRTVISQVLDRWHKAAGEADFETYFSLIAPNGIFIGTDPTENWEKDDFREWAKPYFDRGQAWDFTAIERNIYTSGPEEIAWFDELLETHMGICRGSGVVALQDGSWKIKHYVLSIAIPNENVSEVTSLKKEFDHSLISKLKPQ